MKQNLSQTVLTRLHQLPCAGVAECQIRHWEFNLPHISTPLDTNRIKYKLRVCSPKWSGASWSNTICGMC